jgi:hypothetical protein
MKKKDMLPMLSNNSYLFDMIPPPQDINEGLESYTNFKWLNNGDIINDEYRNMLDYICYNTDRISKNIYKSETFQPGYHIYPCGTFEPNDGFDSIVIDNNKED